MSRPHSLRLQRLGGHTLHTRHSSPQMSHAIPRTPLLQTPHKPRNFNDHNSNPEIVPGELRAKFLRRWQGLAGLRDAAPSHRSATWCHWYGERRRVRRAWPQCWWAAAGPGRASRRRAERSSRRGRLAGGPPHTSTYSGPARRTERRTQRSRWATTSATWTALRAAPLRRLSPETTRTRPRLPSTA